MDNSKKSCIFVKQKRGISSMVEHQPSKLGTSDRYRYPAQKRIKMSYAELAQLEERYVANVEVVGSIPAFRSKLIKGVPKIRYMVKITSHQFLIFVLFVLVSAIGQAQQLYDASGSLLISVRGNVYYDNSGSIIARYRNDAFYDQSGSQIITIRSDNLYKNGRRMGYIINNHIYNNNGSQIGRYGSNRLYNQRGQMIGRIDGKFENEFILFIYFVHF